MMILKWILNKIVFLLASFFTTTRGREAYLEELKTILHKSIDIFNVLQLNFSDDRFRSMISLHDFVYRHRFSIRSFTMVQFCLLYHQIVQSSLIKTPY